MHRPLDLRQLLARNGRRHCLQENVFGLRAIVEGAVMVSATPVLRTEDFLTAARKGSQIQALFTLSHLTARHGNG